MLTLRQVEVLRAVMITGTISGAADLLNVSAPGISRLLKHTESSLGIRIFDRRHGRYHPTHEAKDVFHQLNAVYEKVEGLQHLVRNLERGTGAELNIGSVPSIANVMVPRAIVRVRERHPNILVDVNILKLEEAIDNILLGKVEAVAMSYKIDHPNVDFVPLAKGRLFCVTPMDHPLAERDGISPEEIVKHPLIGIDPNDPYGRIMAEIFARRGLDYQITVRARFGTTVCSLVRAGLGIAVIDQFTVAHDAVPGIRLIEIDEQTQFQTYVAIKADRGMSVFAESFITLLRQEMESVVRPRPD